MPPAHFHATRKPRWTIAALVAVLHVAAVFVLIRTFTPDLVDRASRAMTSIVFTTERPFPRPPRTVAPTAKPKAPLPGGSAAPAGRKTIAPPNAAAPLPVTTASPTPSVGTGEAATASGATMAGAASGAAGQGRGTGAGGSGGGPGAGGGAAPTVKIAGDINSANDYPRAGRERRAGASVIIDLAVGPDGRVDGCRVVQSSPDPEADSITCALATQRFIFRPARGPSGEPVRAVYRWRQRWFS